MHIIPYHFRHQQVYEVDLVLERDDQAIVGIEVKASATVRPEDFKGLRKLAELSGNDFCDGIFLYDGTEVVSFGDNLVAAPISCVWNGISWYRCH